MGEESIKVLLVTNVDRGQANSFLATCHALFQADADIELHFATFRGLEAALATTWQHARLTVPSARPIVFHEIKGLSMAEGLENTFTSREIPWNGFLPDSYTRPLGILNTTRAIRDTVPIFVPYDGPQLVEIVSSIIDIIKTVSADLVVVDALMTPALTACHHLDINFVCLSPNSAKEFSASREPGAPGLWKYPALFSGFSYPVPWYHIPLNIFCVLYTAVKWVTDSHRRAVAKHLITSTGVTLKTPFDLLRGPPPKCKILVGSLLELDFCSAIPPHVLPCGPIVQSAPPVADVEPKLASWLSARPTLYVNLGSLCRLDEDRAVELALALKYFLIQSRSAPGNQGKPSSSLQVLWKLKQHGDYRATKPGCRIHDILGQEIRTGSVRIVGWLVPEPISVLESGNIVCAVHHGGANSFYEAVLTGVPQVVLPQWTDCYDYAQRVEMLGIGRLGNRVEKPLWVAKRLAREIFAVVLGEGSDAIKLRAKEVATLCREKGSGAENAARAILEECQRHSSDRGESHVL
ncbi:hypothetical protein OQA88_3732 [Cercophora sp. LCS_1]